MNEINWKAFQFELENLLNRHSIDNECQTPDFMLADKLVKGLQAEAKFIRKREKWFGRGPVRAKLKPVTK